MVSHRKPAHLSEPTGLAPSGVLRAKQAPSGSKTALRSGARALGKPCQGGKQRQHCRWPPCGLGPALPTRLVLSAPGPAHSSAWARGKDHPCGGFHCEAQLFGLSTSSEEWSGHGVQLGPQGLSSLPWSLNVMTPPARWYPWRSCNPAYKCRRSEQQARGVGREGRQEAGPRGGAHSCATSQAPLLRWDHRGGISDTPWLFRACGLGTGASASTSSAVSCCRPQAHYPCWPF